MKCLPRWTWVLVMLWLWRSHGEHRELSGGRGNTHRWGSAYGEHQAGPGAAGPASEQRPRVSASPASVCGLPHATCPLTPLAKSLPPAQASCVLPPGDICPSVPSRGRHSSPGPPWCTSHLSTRAPPSGLHCPSGRGVGTQREEQPQHSTNLSLKKLSPGKETGTPHHGKNEMLDEGVLS